MRSVLPAAIVLVAAASVRAQTHAELQTMVQQLQANPSDTALRERIIMTARQLNPAPTIPESAHASFVEGTTIARSAKDPAAQALAVQQFQDALKLAPWWGDAYYNLAVAQELAGQIDAAQSSLKLYVLTNPSAKEARAAQDHIYELNGKKRLAEAEANAPAAKAGALLRAIEGQRFALRVRAIGAEQAYYTITYEVRGDQVIRGASTAYDDGGIVPWREMARAPLNGLTFVFRTGSGTGTCDENCPSECTKPPNNYVYECPTYGEIQPDGMSIVERHYDYYSRIYALRSYRR